VELGASTVVVTGAAGGIGRALAEGFLRDDARVVAVDVPAAAARLDELGGAGAVVVVGDVSDPDVVESFVATAVSSTGRLDVLINNAGIGVQRPITDLGADEFERVLRVNLFGPFYGLRTALPVMREQGRGRVVNVISRHAELNPPGLAGYSASKAALWSLTRTAAQETKGSGILVNALIPGPTKTGLNPVATQEPEAVYPTARMLATLPDDGPTGRCFWNLEEYRMYERPAPGA
jgi:NAD(P)-dependent dehydrogenase (short-subunit alcohol dehydrogenase family)